MALTVCYKIHLLHLSCILFKPKSYSGLKHYQLQSDEIHINFDRIFTISTDFNAQSYVLLHLTILFYAFNATPNFLSNVFVVNENVTN